MNLSDVFVGVAHKLLVAVDLPGLVSHQHELNGVAALQDLFGTDKPTQGRISWHFFADDRESACAEGDFTFYDARAKSAVRTKRTEWRFYYEGKFLVGAHVGDLFVLARTRTGQVFGLVFEKDSAWFRAALALFGIESARQSFTAMTTKRLDTQRLEFFRRQILAELGIEVEIPVVISDQDLMLANFDRKFPTTQEMSAFARSQVDVDLRHADDVLVRWLEREEQLFRALESVIIGKRLKQGFASVDEFIGYSLSVQNRRKSRMGHALQNQMAELFTLRGLHYTPQAKTEAENRPDFIFPGEREYHDRSFDVRLLVMLGVKSTSKDRWRQVLTEADRIPLKHLCTLEAGISSKQTNEMRRQRLTLVVPQSLHATYTPAQCKQLLSLDEFIKFVAKKQAAA